MGWYFTLVAATLDWEEGGFIQRNELLQFAEEVFVAWCRPARGDVPTGWTTLAANTLRVKIAPGGWGDRVAFATNPVYPGEDAHSFAYYAEGFGMPIDGVSAIFHLALPPGFLPPLATVDPFPLYAWQHADRFVLGWEWRQGVAFRLALNAVEPGDYAAKARELERNFRAAKIQREQTPASIASLPLLEAEIDSVLRQLQTHRGNLLFLQEQQALHGPIDIPLDLMNNIRLTQEEIERLEQRLVALTAQRQTR